MRFPLSLRACCQGLFDPLNHDAQPEHVVPIVGVEKPLMIDRDLRQGGAARQPG